MNLQEKVDKLMNKLETLEGALKDERKIRIKLEEELKECKQITIPILQKQLEDKDALLKTVFIDKIRLEKESMEKECKSKVNEQITLDYHDAIFRCQFLFE